MELRQLASFVAVAEELHFGRAATRLNITQPPLSRQIRQLEKELGVEMLRRTRRRVELTEPGKTFLDEARAVLAQAERAARAARRAGGGRGRRLRVGHVAGASFDILPEAMRDFHQRAPEVRLALEESTTEPLIHALEDARLDVAFLRPPGRQPEPELEFETVGEEPFVVVLPDTHRLATRDRVSLTLLEAEPFVLVPRGVAESVYDQIMDVCRQAGFHPHITEEGFPVSSVVMLVAAGLGVSLLPASISRHCHQEGVAYKALEDPAPTVDLCLAWRRDETSPVVHAFIEAVRQHTSRCDG